jgi:hypothetical protein
MKAMSYTLQLSELIHQTPACAYFQFQIEPYGTAQRSFPNGLYLNTSEDQGSAPIQLLVGEEAWDVKERDQKACHASQIAAYSLCFALLLTRPLLALVKSSALQKE